VLTRELPVMQYRYGGTMKEAFRTLYSQGGIPRFYKGLLPALFQARMHCTTLHIISTCAWHPP
jgi:hypothetical protein